MMSRAYHPLLPIEATPFAFLPTPEEEWREHCALWEMMADEQNAEGSIRVDRGQPIGPMAISLLDSSGMGDISFPDIAASPRTYSNQHAQSFSFIDAFGDQEPCSLAGDEVCMGFSPTPCGIQEWSDTEVRGRVIESVPAKHMQNQKIPPGGESYTTGTKVCESEGARDQSEIYNTISGSIRSENHNPNLLPSNSHQPLGISSSDSIDGLFDGYIANEFRTMMLAKSQRNYNSCWGQGNEASNLSLTCVKKEASKYNASVDMANKENLPGKSPNAGYCKNIDRVTEVFVEDRALEDHYIHPILGEKADSGIHFVCTSSLPPTLHDDSLKLDNSVRKRKKKNADIRKVDYTEKHVPLGNHGGHIGNTRTPLQSRECNQANQNDDTQVSTNSLLKTHPKSGFITAYPVRTRHGIKSLPLISPFPLKATSGDSEFTSSTVALIIYDRTTREWRVFWKDGHDARYKVFQCKKYGKDRAYGLAVEYARQLGRTIS